MPTIDVNGTRLYYEEEGEGYPLVMLHGLFGSGKTFRNEVRQLKGHFRVIVPDARGHGQSDKPPEYKLEDHVKDVVALLDKLEIESCYLLGVSMGSYIAQGVAIAIPERIKKLVLIVSKSNGKTSSVQELFVRHAEEMKDIPATEKFAYATRYIFHRHDVAQKTMGDWDKEQMTLTDPKEQAAANKAVEGFDFRDRLPAVTARTLVISGKHDGLNPPERGREIASLIAGSTFSEFEFSGHAPSVEEPERFMSEVTAFLTMKD
ncbi:alpha/beta fold hydrolase [Cohnella soli]|uniref:Alpha/beta fold hydrolase n=1 Tax=Cohnella soli TaxID=425005 RepID=A0ABW0I163_9BACL